MQTENSETLAESNINLTDSATCLGQKLEGKTDEDYFEIAVLQYEEHLKSKYPYHLKFLTLQELDEYLNLDHWLELKFNQKYTRERFLKQQRYEELFEKVDWFYISQQIELDFQKLKHQKILDKQNKIKSNNKFQLGAREFTFTYSPKWFDDAEARLRMSSAIQKICKYYKDEIIQLRAVGEVGTNGLSHIHCFYKLRNGVKITDKNFKRAYGMWDTHIKQGPTGHKGGHHANVRSEADFQGYIDKDIENAWFEVNIDNSSDPTN